MSLLSLLKNLKKNACNLKYRFYLKNGNTNHARLSKGTWRATRGIELTRNTPPPLRNSRCTAQERYTVSRGSNEGRIARVRAHIAWSGEAHRVPFVWVAARARSPIRAHILTRKNTSSSTCARRCTDDSGGVGIGTERSGGGGQSVERKRKADVGDSGER